MGMNFKIMFSNCYVDGGKAWFSLKKSLSLFVKTPNLNIWQSQRESNPCYRNENPMS